MSPNREEAARDVGMGNGAETGGDGDGDGTGGDGRVPETGAAAGHEPIPRSARALVAGLLVAVLVPGLVGFDLWPLTGWRLFSLSRSSTQSSWVLEGVKEDGSTRVVDLDELPMAYSNAEWPLRSAGGGSWERREELCRALLDAVVDVDPEMVELRIARDRQELVRSDGSWTVSHDLDVRHTCGPEESS